MARIFTWWAYMTMLDSRNKTTDVQFRVSELDAETWGTAESTLLRDGSEIGILFAAIEGLSACTVVERGVKMADIDDAAVKPAADANVYTFDKLTVGVHAGIDNYTFTIPGRDDAAYTVGEDGVSVILSGDGASAAVEALVAAVPDAYVGKNGAEDGTVTYIEVHQ